MKKKVMVTAVALTMLVGGYLSFTTVDEQADKAVAGAKTYEATFYVAGMGGHFAKADATIDPNNTEQPIILKGMPGMVNIGRPNTHPTHDARIDANDRNIMFWSTYRPDADGNLHVGKTDLSTGRVLIDKALPPDERATWTGANYCGSGQSNDYFMPVYMGNEGYIDVFSKDDLSHKHRVFFDDLGYGSGEYTFAHGTNSPDMKHFLLSLNLTPDGHTQFTGNTQLILLDMKALEQGKVKKVAEAKITGKPRDASGGTITFRQYYTEDGKQIFQSGGDRGYIIDAKTLEVKQVAAPLPGEAHDFMPTPDGKYGVFALRNKVFSAADEGDVTDGSLALYDVKARKMVGEVTSVCLTCHNAMGMTGSAILCGLDANYK
ncbi:hypothetical protein [Desulfurivibrio dismutans]|uniref:hypothetical protein n=1 Tax=Desulfurivibrio dismutans TaxID=1398908 RepID=UPI0023DC6EF0|nr:hypothetical protein [Desulfurivibrio alkaliphilus]MDF1614610.1 hypothetical protein [Desulfurivibrio alkaliphilus]